MSTVMVVLLWGAAVYRIVLSVRSETTVWRTAFTVCIVGVAVAAALTAYGKQTIDSTSGLWNLSLLLSHLALVVAAAATSIYVATLKRSVVPHRAVGARVAVATGICAVEIVSWIAAPLHGPDLKESSEATASGCVFAVVFAATIVFATLETAYFSLSQAASRDDLTRTISLYLTGSACLAGAVLFSVAGGATVVKFLTGTDVSRIKAAFDLAVPYVLVVLALGTLSLLIAPPIVDIGRHYVRWRSLQPLWEDLIRQRPEVHLDVPLTGGPVTKLRMRVQRTVVEIHDALRVIPVSVPAHADVSDLGRALHHVGGPQLAAEVLAGTGTEDDNKADQLVALARTYARYRR